MASEKNVWPTFRYADAKAAIAFLQNAFGFQIAAQYDDENDPTVVMHAELRWPEGGGVMLGSAREESVMSHVGVAAGSAYVVTDDVDAIFQRATAAGATVLLPPTDQEYGSRDFVVKDPEGVVWSFGTYRGTDHSPA